MHVLCFLLLIFSVLKVNGVFALDEYITVECLQNGLKIKLELNNLQRKIKIYEPMKLVFIGTNYTKTCEMEMDSGSQPISILIPKVCLSNDTIQKVLLTADSKIIHKFEISCDQVLKDIIIAADLNGESIEINSSVQIGFDLSLMISSKHIPFRIVDCWTEQNNHRANFLKNGIPERDSRSVPLCQLSNRANNFESNINPLNKYSNFQQSSINQISKVWQIWLRLGWDIMPDSRQKALQQLLRTKPQLQWKAIPDFLFDTKDFLSPITIYPIMIQCSISPLSFKRTSGIASFGPIGVFIPQFYFLEDFLFSCCPVETTIAYSNLLRHLAQKKFFCSKVSITTALLVSLASFAIAVCCTAITFSIRYKN
uniref:Bm337, isoform a; Bm337, isoform c n=2 Tax=Brugia malayi TaxID=6279 RepID=A0A912H4H3_BRUMA